MVEFENCVLSLPVPAPVSVYQLLSPSYVYTVQYIIIYIYIYKYCKSAKVPHLYSHLYLIITIIKQIITTWSTFCTIIYTQKKNLFHLLCLPLNNCSFSYKLGKISNKTNEWQKSTHKLTSVRHFQKYFDWICKLVQVLLSLDCWHRVCVVNDYATLAFRLYLCDNQIAFFDPKKGGKSRETVHLKGFVTTSWR